MNPVMRCGLMAASLAGAALLLAACAQQPSRDQVAQLQTDVTAMRAEVGRLSGQIDRLDHLIRPPAPPRATVGIAGSPVIGNPQAKVAVVAFSDFQCPFCGRFHAGTYPELKEHYIDTGRVMLVYRDLPLDFHPAAKGAAVAAFCAAAQGRFEAMADALFDGQDRLGTEYYKETAAKLGLDTSAFDTCLGDTTAAKKIAHDMADAASLGVEGTPTFFIGRVDGDRVVDAEGVYGAQPYAALADVIDGLLKDDAPRPSN